MFYPRDAPLLMRHTTPSHLPASTGSGDDMLTPGEASGSDPNCPPTRSVGLTKRVRHLEGERQRAAASRRTAREAEDEARMHLGSPLMVLADGSHKTHFKPAGGSSCAFNGNPPTCDRLRDQSYVQAQ
ncbi:uncharacterized protein BXZ73DRAFT_81434 [Epithele typhae]|uniref:uncharacterized protein n=1 Tax=Epithele typhae TaxID=378194 RepID=UPI002008C7D9|nr:uncharacterized protein BXZ73DRAFT_81434 [Epithele typhae]KAH9915174.1 hypothetical protein BXZ73DRAFT_81434 [Epithele typhae]